MTFCCNVSSDLLITAAVTLHAGRLSSLDLSSVGAEVNPSAAAFRKTCKVKSEHLVSSESQCEAGKCQSQSGSIVLPR